MVAKKTTSRSMSADTYEKQAKNKSAQLRTTDRRYNRLEAALIDAGVPVSRAKQEAQLIMERNMRNGIGRTPKKGK